MLNFEKNKNQMKSSFESSRRSFGIMYLLTLFVNLLIVFAVLGTIIFIALKIIEKVG